ncbi:cilia- and flagella-associated protein 54 isoform X1 [Astyanax mexicanus]|uniref:cilia- and flagella-associated protein 54 isoform X1 n=1 Tax=Astyanax mexicanus TaxID=7994 RepID=UPI0020CB2577|nr:cilia- and flagella-associated protein 54 isoform X1 [Astyanax mexicanus]
MEPLPASYYGKLDKNNPVISSLEKDLKEFRLHMKKVREAPNFNHLSYSRGSIKLFDIWKKYQPRLPAPYFEECLLQTADFLYECKFYRLAQWHGYSRYLHRFCAAGLESIKDVEQFKQTFFPDGFDTEGAKLTFRALQGECLCEFYLEREQYSAPHKSGVQKLLAILAFLRLMMQAIMPHENLCWILYNGSLHIYNICRFLMSVSHSAQALEYLLWACVSLELSIPLLMPRFLPWRATLYCAVCECYYDGQAGVQAEVFARRALGKISELATLEDMSGSLSSAETQRAFKEATIKLAVMVFKQSVYESRRKNRGYFRAERRRSFKESHNISWPRTLTERMLMELFEGNAAQFLAVLEALRVSSRRLLHTGFSDKPEVQEVVLELMSAGISILSGNGGSSDRVRNDELPPSLSAITPTFTIMEMARAGENLISVDAAVKFVKLLFTYEQWDTFCSLSKSLVTVLSNLEVRCFQKAELELTLLEALEHLVSTHKIKLYTKETLPGEDKSVDQIAMTDELLNLVQTLHVCVCEAAQGIQLDGDMVVDIVLFLWARCKIVFQKAQGLHSDSVCYLGRSENQDKWAQTLFLLCEVVHECQLTETDPVMVAEMTIRLAMVLEGSADSPPRTGTKTASTEVNSSQSTPTGKHSHRATPLLGSQAELLEIAFSVLERGLECLSRGRAALLHCDASAIADTAFLQKFGGVYMRSSGNGQPESTRTSFVSVICMDLHVEMLAFYHRVFIKLLDTFPDDEIAGSRMRSVAQTDQGRSSREHSMKARAESVLLEKIKKNKISKALFLMQKSLLSHKKDSSTKKGSKKLLEEAAALLEKAELDEKRLAGASVPVEMRSEAEDGCTPPPPPVLLTCSNWCMTFTPAPYALEEKVSWYRIYSKEVEGHNLKVRIGDSHLPGTGDTIPSRGERLFCVSGLEPNQKYIFAVAAYDAQGNIVGKTIGEATRPLLAYLPLPLLTTWAHLAQVAYQTGQYAVAKKACSELWSHFTMSLTPDSGGSPVPKNESGLEGFAEMRLRPEFLQVSSPLLQQLCLSTMFIQTDIHIQERALYCDSHFERSMLIWEQEDRLAECERMLVAIDMALHLNDSSGALQAIVNCYGLLAPLIYYQIPSDAVIQVMLKCLTGLQEIPAVLKQKRPAATAESLQHMVACITHYLAKALQTLKKYPLASSVIEQGKKLLQEITQSPQQTPSRHALIEQNGREKLQKKARMEELREQLEALEGIVTKSEEVVCEAATDPQYPELTGNEDPAVLQMVIGQSSLQNAFKDVMKFKRRSFFMKFAGLLLQRAFQENQLELLLQWGQEIFSRLSRQEERLPISKKNQEQKSRELKKFTSSVIEYSNKKQLISVPKDKKKKEQKLSSQGTLTPETMWSGKQAKAMETLRKHLAPLSRKKLRRMRQKGTKECLLCCHINLVLAQAHLGLLRKNLETQSRMTLQKCYNKMPPLLFSLAHTGTLVKWKNVPQHIRPPELSFSTLKGMPPPKPIHKAKHTSKAPHITEDKSAEGEVDSELDTSRTQLTDDSDISEPEATVTPTQHMDFQPLDILCKASVHLRKAMVLAHRERAWMSLQWVCGIMWDQMSTIAFGVECGKTSDSHSKLTLDQFYTVFTPLLVLASDLLMDMMERLQKWKVYNEEDEDLEAGSLGGGMLRDLLWLRNVVLHTLELLYYQGKWETLSYLAFRYNTYTWGHYTHIITPLLVHAQRRLLDRINYFEGPPAPQPHFIHTETATGEKITCRNYAGKQLLLHWSSSAQNQHKGTAGNAGPELLQLAEVNRAMCVVCVPLDIEDTLRCFRETMTKRRHTLRAFQHSRTLLLLLLADTQHSMEVPFWKEFHSELQGKVEFNLAATNPPSISPPDLTNEDYSSVGSVYSSPLPPSHIQTVLSSYSSTIKYLQANKYNALLVQALHDVGNLHFYNGNQKAAHLHWSKALDCALQCTGVQELWDGDSWPSSSTQEPLRDVGIWGCLQGALLSAKIAQYILTSDISQRTKCCLLSAKLFKCLLKASLPHPDNDLEYSSYSLKTELIPGLDVFSEPEWGIAAGAVASLDFLCHWLYTSGHHLTVLPLLAIYQYIASMVCRDPHHTVSCRILKVKVLTELCLFAEAVREIHILTLGEEVPVAYNSYSGGGETEAEKSFRNSRPLLDPSNLQVLKEVVNKRPSEDVMALYGSKLTHRLFLARIQLITALCSTIHDLPEPVSPEMMLESQLQSSVSSDPGTPNHSSEEFPCNSPDTKNSVPKGLQLDSQKDKLTLGQVKAWLLREASNQLRSQLFALQNIHTDPEELELDVETRLLLSGLSLQQGKTAYSADLAVSALRLLQDSPLFQSKNVPQLPPSAPVSAFRQSSAKTKLQQTGLQGSDPAPDTDLRDVQVGVKAVECMGCSFWLRCRLSVVQSFTAHLPGTAVCPGVDSSVEAARLLKEGLAEAEAWGDPDTQALLLLQEATLNTHCGKSPVESASILQEAVSLLSGRNALSLPSGLALAKATLLLSELRRTGSQSLYLLTQKLLQQQLCTLGESIVLKAGGGLELPSTQSLRNIYHPQLPLLARATMHLGHSLALQAMNTAVEDGEDPSKPWTTAQEVLQSAFIISQTSACRDQQLEAEILYCRGMVERILMSLDAFQHQAAVETFLQSITLTHSHSHNLQLIHRCYIEMALIYLQHCQNNTTAFPKPASSPALADSHTEPQASENVTVDQSQILLFWVCLRAAIMTMEGITSSSQLCSFANLMDGHLPLTSFKALPDFAANDLLHPCGGMEDPVQLCRSPTPDEDNDQSSRYYDQLTWVHLCRYHTHLLNLRHIATRPVVEQCVDGFMSAAGGSHLFLKLAQLHTFFGCHLEAYKEQYVVPDPPAALIRMPQTTQLVDADELSECRPKQLVSDLYPWTTVDTQQLCIQWYRPALELNRLTPNMIMLIFGLNKVPLSAVQPNSVAVAELKAGQRLISEQRLKTLHDQLISVCIEVKEDSALSASPASSTTSSISSPKKIRSSSKSLDKFETLPQRQMLLEKTKHTCTEIRNLLKPELKSHPVTEVPFEPSVQTLCDLERCFNPTTGAILKDKVLIDWLFSLLL